ncbi:pantoate--beta-alanine ligase [bacterium]|nr:pantoate--beta-alanine ligase [bacterium]
METVSRPEDARYWVLACQDRKERVGLVPTMGALHEGHLSLVRAARNDCERVVVSIFVNPAQFSPGEDLETYPRPRQRDLELCEREGVDLVFEPLRGDMYLPGHSTYVHVEGLSAGLEGAHRPNFFRGVATVVLKLFHILPADVAYFGRKDAQQLAVVRRMVQDLFVPIEIKACPTVREPDGLAMSSRNAYLSPEERAAAPALYQALMAGRRAFLSGARDPAAVTEAARRRLAEEERFLLQYLECVDAETFQPAVAPLSGRELLATAAFLGSTRLIDNIQLQEG